MRRRIAQFLKRNGQFKLETITGQAENKEQKVDKQKLSYRQTLLDVNIA